LALAAVLIGAFIPIHWQRMRLQPKRAGLDGRIDSGRPPPIGFISTTVHLAMMAPAQWHRELIADLATERWGLRKAQVVGVRWLPSANQAWLFGNRFDVFAVADPAGFR
jgi:hypothetical protein